VAKAFRIKFVRSTPRAILSSSVEIFDTTLAIR